MTLAEAIEFLKPAVVPETLTWADLGAGAGTFTEALAHLVGAMGAVLAVDNDPVATARLGARVRRLPSSAAPVVVVSGDIQRLSSIPELVEGEVQAALLANVLHYFRDPDRLLEEASRLTGRGRLVVVEYDRVSGNRWVPYPISKEKLRAVASAAGFGPTMVVSERPSQFGGLLYCAVLTMPDDPDA